MSPHRRRRFFFFKCHYPAENVVGIYISLEFPIGNPSLTFSKRCERKSQKSPRKSQKSQIPHKIPRRSKITNFGINPNIWQRCLAGLQIRACTTHLHSLPYLRVVFPGEIIISNGSQAGKLFEVFETFVFCLRRGN